MSDSTVEAQCTLLHAMLGGCLEHPRAQRYLRTVQGRAQEAQLYGDRAWRRASGHCGWNGVAIGGR